MPRSALRLRSPCALHNSATKPQTTRSHTLAPSSLAKASSSTPLAPYRSPGRAVAGCSPLSFLSAFSSAAPSAPRLTASLLALRPPRRPLGSASSARPSLRSWLACSPSLLARALRAWSRRWRAPRAGGPACYSNKPFLGARSWGARGRSLARMRPRVPLSLALGGARRAWALSRPPAAPVESPTPVSLPLGGCACLSLVSFSAAMVLLGWWGRCRRCRSTTMLFLVLSVLCCRTLC